MKIFNRTIRKKHIQQFEQNIAVLLEDKIPQIKTAIGLSKIYEISFMEKPKGIYISHGYKPDDFEIANKNYNTHFNLFGISVFNKKQKSFEPIKLYFQSYSLTRIEVENPKYFHKTFDINQIKKNEIKLDYLKLKNQYKKTTERILKSLKKKQIELLELDYSFEIEYDEKSYFTILDMEDGNYIAVDKKGNVYRLNHDQEERIKLIADSPNNFFKIYNGSKTELEKIIN